MVFSKFLSNFKDLLTPSDDEKINLVQNNNITTDFFMTEKGEKIVSFVHGEALDWQVVN